MSTGSLILYPAGAVSPETARGIIRALADAGFIGRPIEGRQDAYLVGDYFLQLVTFMGCSPHIELAPSPDGGDDFCHIRIHDLATPRLLFGTNTRPPRCPACRRALHETAAALAGRDEHSEITCPHCGARHRLPALHWRRDAGYGRFFVEVVSVFPGEAVPVEGLMQRLARSTHGPWDHFYLVRPA